jgi:hypothetical protein
VLPAIRHTHPGGGDPHHHEHADRGIHLHGDWDHDHHAVAAPHPHESSGGMLEAVTHLHVTWLGFEFSWPQHDPADDGEQDEPTGELVMVASEVEASPPVRVSICEVVAPSVASRPHTQCFTSLRLVHRFPVRTLLCDIARRERSGVLLA